MTLGKPIIIGKRYRLHVRKSAEYECTGCRAVFSDNNELDGTIVTVDRDWSGKKAECRQCHLYQRVSEGIFSLSGENRIVPYLWLERLDDEDYGD